jgi:cathepsin B
MRVLLLVTACLLTLLPLTACDPFTQLGNTIVSSAATPSITSRVPNSAIAQSIIDEINSVSNNTWSAGRNEYLEGKSAAYIAQSCGMKMDEGDVGMASLDPAPDMDDDISSSSMAALPETFDVREKWGGICSSLHEIRDQAGCGSCWAVAAAAIMTDRTCIASNGGTTPNLSALNVLSCCGDQCGSCAGGYPLYAMRYWRDTGVVTGGEYGSKGTCQPYHLAQCQHHVEGPRPKCVAVESTPTCNTECAGSVAALSSLSSSPSLQYSQDKHFGKIAYKIDQNEHKIMRDLYQNGPLEAGFMVYQDFPHYKSGVYQHVTGEKIGGHAIKLMGWGVEGGVKYWLAANSWNTDWGNGGWFKIRRGDNHCLIESMVYGGLPN